MSATGEAGALASAAEANSLWERERRHASTEIEKFYFQKSEAGSWFLFWFHLSQEILKSRLKLGPISSSSKMLLHSRSAGKKKFPMRIPVRLHGNFLEALGPLSPGITHPVVMESRCGFPEIRRQKFQK